MYFLKQLHEQEIEGTFFNDSLKTESEIEFLSSSGSFFQGWEILSKPIFCFGILALNKWKFSGCEYFVVV